MGKDDFYLPQGHYLLNHSVGRPLKSLQSHCQECFWAPWQSGLKEPWPIWLKHIQHFQQGLATLLNHSADNFCPQTNISSGLTKLLLSKTHWRDKPIRVLLTERDFPSIGFVFQRALPNAQLEFIPHDRDVSDSNTWQSYIHNQIDLVFVSHAYSNIGHTAPVNDITLIAKKNNAEVILDVAQSLAVLPLDLTELGVDFVLGSSVKWLCAGPGAAFLWASDAQLPLCQPKDVGWFSHQTPFEFDIHHFEYAASALKFWGGTPSILPFIMAAHSLDYFNDLTVERVRAHNWQLVSKLYSRLGDYSVSPNDIKRSSGTAVFNLGLYQDAVLSACQSESIAIDMRADGIRVSPHVYNDEAEIMAFVDLVNRVIQA